MSISPNSFKKKKIPYDFSDNAMMTSSVKAYHRSTQDEAYLTLQKELKKVKKSYQQLSYQYARMKDWTIADATELDLRIQQSKHQIAYLKQEKNMLKARVRYLEKESTQMKKSSQKPLNRSIIKSGLKRSTLDNPDTSNLYKSSYSPLKTDRSLNSCTSLQNTSNSQRDSFGNPSQLDDLLFVQDGSVSNTVKFDKNWNDTKPLIDDQNQTDECQDCGNQKCLKNYEQLQRLRDHMSFFARSIEDIFMKIQFKIQNKLNQKSLRDHKQKLHALWKQSSGSEYFLKTSPMYMLKKIEEKVRFFLKCKSYQNYNPLLGKVEQKMKKIKTEEEALRKQLIFETYNDEEAQKKDIDILMKNDQMYKRFENILKMKGVKNPKFEQLRKKQQQFTKSELKKVGIQKID